MGRGLLGACASPQPEPLLGTGLTGGIRQGIFALKWSVGEKSELSNQIILTGYGARSDNMFIECSADFRIKISL